MRCDWMFRPLGVLFGSCGVLGYYWCRGLTYTRCQLNNMCNSAREPGRTPGRVGTYVCRVPVYRGTRACSCFWPRQLWVHLLQAYWGRQLACLPWELPWCQKPRHHAYTVQEEAQCE